MTERFQRMKDTFFQFVVGALITAILGVCGFIAITAVELKSAVSVTNARLESTNTQLAETISETKENQKQIYTIRWELAQWKKEEQDLRQ